MKSKSDVDVDRKYVYFGGSDPRGDGCAFPAILTATSTVNNCN